MPMPPAPLPAGLAGQYVVVKLSGKALDDPRWAADIAALRASGAASGGMLPKLQACADAVQQGVGMVRIVRAGAPLLHALDPGRDLGTLVVHHGL